MGRCLKPELLLLPEQLEFELNGLASSLLNSFGSGGADGVGWLLSTSRL